MKELSWTLRMVPLLLLLPAVVRGAVDIPMSCRISNPSENRCGWCALETLARYHGVTVLYGLAEKHSTRASAEDLEAVVDGTHTNFRVQDAGCYHTMILRYAVREKLGAVVGFRERTAGAGRHLVTLVDFGPKEVRVIDPNDQDGRIRTMSLQRFLSWWDGFTLVLEPESRFD